MDIPYTIASSIWIAHISVSLTEVMLEIMFHAISAGCSSKSMSSSMNTQVSVGDIEEDGLWLGIWVVVSVGAVDDEGN